MRLLLVGAFTYPHDQGSQVYFQEQAIALRAAGAEVELLTYGPGRGSALAPGGDAATGPGLGDPDRWRALDGFEHSALPAWSTPATSRSGPRPGKPFADLMLAVALRRTLRTGRRERASSDASSHASEHSLRCASFDAILAHHAEAALLALHSLPRGHPPVVYCAHTLLEHELPEYFHPARARVLAAIGRALDHGIARRSDAWIALTQSAERVIGNASSRPGKRLAPPLPDPALACDRRETAAVAHAHGLVPGRYFLYSGNLDPYQDLPLLERLVETRPDPPSGARFPIVIATHDERASELASRSEAARSGSGLRVRRIRSSGEANALVASARASIVPRRVVGGFPIKLVNSLAAGTPVVAFHGEEWGLSDRRDSLLGSLDRPAASLARALDELEADEPLATRLGAGARATYLAHHDPARVAAETLALVETLLSKSPTPR